MIELVTDIAFVLLGLGHRDGRWSASSAARRWPTVFSALTC